MKIALLTTAVAGLAAQVPVDAVGPAVVVNHRILYATASSGRIQAHGLPGGRRLWESDRPARLIGLLDTRPVGLVGCQSGDRPSWCLAVIDTAKGRQGAVAAQSGPLPFPDYAPSFRAGPEWDRIGHTYRALGTNLYIVAIGGGSGRFSLAWSASWRYTGGARPPATMQTRRNDAGVFVVNFREGTVTAGPDILSVARFVPRPDRYDGPLAHCKVTTGTKAKVDEWLWREPVSLSCQQTANTAAWAIDLEPTLFRDHPVPP